MNCKLFMEKWLEKYISSSCFISYSVSFLLFMHKITYVIPNTYLLLTFKYYCCSLFFLVLYSQISYPASSKLFLLIWNNDATFVFSHFFNNSIIYSDIFKFHFRIYLCNILCHFNNGLNNFSVHNIYILYYILYP